MSREAMQMALDALEQLQGGCTDHDDGTVEAITVWCPEVIAALQAALAEQPEHEPGGPLVEGWEVTVGSGHAGYGAYAHLTEYPEEGAYLLALAEQPAAPAVLTDAEIDTIMATAHNGKVYPADFHSAPMMMRRVEARAVLAAAVPPGSVVVKDEPVEKGSDALEWAVSRWLDEVSNRPLVNAHRRTLDDTWRQVIRHFGGDPDALIGPSHDALIAARPEAK